MIAYPLPERAGEGPERSGPTLFGLALSDRAGDRRERVEKVDEQLIERRAIPHGVDRELGKRRGFLGLEVKPEVAEPEIVRIVLGRIEAHLEVGQDGADRSKPAKPVAGVLQAKIDAADRDVGAPEALPQ